MSGLSSAAFRARGDCGLSSDLLLRGLSINIRQTELQLLAGTHRSSIIYDEWILLALPSSSISWLLHRAEIQAAVEAHVAGRGERRRLGDSSADLPVEGPVAVVWSGAGAAAAHVGGGVSVEVEVTFHLLSVLASQDTVKGVWDAIA